ncbi:MAG: phosphotriesterase-related protein [Bacillota bacterium]|nr:phosphotriesterase-related protein [Bacillota bacterium]HHT89735.1 phosphotriesterase-related protein [Bacillota bacterium]
MSIVNTIKGPIPSRELGFTYTHEHLVCFPPRPAMKDDPDYQLPSTSKAIEELEYFYAAGGRTLVEGTARDYGRDVMAMNEIAQKTAVNIIFCTGYNKSRFYDNETLKASEGELADLMIKELTEGVGDTGLKPGYIKCGSWYNVITPEEEKVTKAAAKAHLATKAPIWVHTEAGTMGLEQLDILEAAGVNLHKVCVGHMDRNPDLWLHCEVAKRGAYVGYDGPGKVKYFPDSVRIELIKGMIAKGFQDRLLISGDMGRQSYLRAYHGGPGFEYIIKKFIPRMLAEGIAQSYIDQIWVENPAEWLGV